mgnify:CR=1 FL=1
MNRKSIGKSSNSQSLKRIKYLMENINSLQRMANSEGMDNCFKIIKKKCPNLKVHKFKPGAKAGDWTVPKNWKLQDSFLKDDKGKIIASSKENHLFVSPNSKSVDKKINGEKLIEKTMFLEKITDSFLLNHKHTYNYHLRQKDWGISLPYNRVKKISKNKKYHISIKTDLSNEPMKVGELFIKGKVNKIICISAHIDELCNDDLSGSVAAIELYERLKKKQNYFSYQILLFPELYGPLFYIKRFPAKIKNTLFMLNLECVGAGKQWCLKKSLKSNNFLEDCLRKSFKENKKKFKELKFFDGFINDEKVYAWPEIDIPGIAIQRNPYKYYHTSQDTLDKIDYNLMLDSIKISEDMMRIFEKNFQIINKNYIPKLKTYLPPWLTKRKLYISGKNSIFPQDEGNNTYNEKLLFSIDGKTSLYKIATKLNLKFLNCFNYLQTFIKKNLVKKIKIDGKHLLY